MKTEEQMVRHVRYVSEHDPRIVTDVPKLGTVIEWADSNPVVYDVVRTSRSKAFGRGASFYVGWAQGVNTNEAILERLRALHVLVEKEKLDLWTWSALFTLRHFKDKDFTGGGFQQWAVWSDGKEYPRHNATLDYTPKTLERVLDRFCEWMNEREGVVYERTTRITVDGDDRRVFATAATNGPRAGEQAKRAKSEARVFKGKARALKRRST